MSSKNCNYIEIHETSVGAVHQCSECESLKIEIGTMMALISRKSFRLILDDFIERKKFYEENDTYFESHEKITICLNQCNLFLCLTSYEFDEVVNLFQVSNHMLKAKDILDVSL